MQPPQDVVNLFHLTLPYYQTIFSLTTHIFDRTAHSILVNRFASFHLECAFLHDTSCWVFDAITKLARSLWISWYLKIFLNKKSHDAIIFQLNKTKCLLLKYVLCNNFNFVLMYKCHHKPLTWNWKLLHGLAQPRC